MEDRRKLRLSTEGNQVNPFSPPTPIFFFEKQKEKNTSKLPHGLKEQKIGQV